MFTYSSTSVLRVSLSIFGIGNGLVWLGWVPYSNKNLYSGPVQYPNATPNMFSCF